MNRRAGRLIRTMVVRLYRIVSFFVKTSAIENANNARWRTTTKARRHRMSRDPDIVFRDLRSLRVFAVASICELQEQRDTSR
jgi:hypothetical protein